MMLLVYHPGSVSDATEGVGSASSLILLEQCIGQGLQIYGTGLAATKAVKTAVEVAI